MPELRAWKEIAPQSLEQGAVTAQSLHTLCRCFSSPSVRQLAYPMANLIHLVDLAIGLVRAFPLFHSVESYSSNPLSPAMQATRRRLLQVKLTPKLIPGINFNLTNPGY